MASVSIPRAMIHAGICYRASKKIPGANYLRFDKIKKERTEDYYLHSLALEGKNKGERTAPLLPNYLISL